MSHSKPQILSLIHHSLFNSLTQLINRGFFRFCRSFLLFFGRFQFDILSRAPVRVFQVPQAEDLVLLVVISMRSGGEMSTSQG